MAKNILKIGLDFDGVIADTIKVKHELAKKFFDVEIESHRFKEYMVIEDEKLKHDEYRYLMNNVCGNMDYGLDMEEVQRSVKHVKELLSLGHDVRVITSRAGSEVDVAREWLRLRGLELDIVSVGYASNKVEPARGLDVYMDDDAPKLEPLVGVVENSFLFSNIHNQGHEFHNAVVRVDSWQDFKDRLQAIYCIYG